MPERHSDHPLYQKRPAPVDSSPPPAREPPQPLREKPLLTYALAAILGAVYLAGFLLPDVQTTLLRQGALIPSAVIDEGQVWRLLTAMFLHASLGHVFFNGYALFLFGSEIETLFGRARLLVFYLLGGLSGSALSLALSGGSWSVGASGAVFALFTALALHLHQHRHVYAHVRRKLRHMLFLLGLNLFIGFMPNSRIDNWGHIGGMLGGLLLAWRVAPRFPLPTMPLRTMRELAKTDRNPLRLQLPFVALYVGGLIVFVALAIVLRA